MVWSLLGVLAGAFLALQAPVNAELSRGLGLPVAAAAISFLAGAVVLAGLSAAIVRTEGMSLDWRAPAPWLFVAGGCLGGAYVTIATMLVPRAGAMATMAFIVTGQLLGGMVIDRLGLLGVAVREISLGRAAGAMLLVAGALMIRLL
ncbi:MAG TPA: DMT family transporter [Rhizobiales bacterium]|nr:DMT family transporter [Hyphomicrobiales bacterium]